MNKLWMALIVPLDCPYNRRSLIAGRLRPQFQGFSNPCLAERYDPDR